ncbi:MAG: ABC transporter ATP-binding protein [Desulfosoma sp.]
MGATVIDVRGLCVRYPNQPIPTLRGLDAEFRQGETTLLLGPTGSGKSTLAFALCGVIPQLLKADVSGSVRILGRSPWETPLWRTCRTLGFLLQDVNAMAFTERVEDEIAFGLENACVAPQAMETLIERALNFVNAKQLRGRLLRTLSSGELQRVMIAALLALDQRFLILDEPCAYLDQQSRGVLLDLLGALADQGKSLVVIEHRPELFRTTGVRPFYLHQGRLSSQTPSQESLAPVPKGPPGRVCLRFEDVEFGYGDADGFPLLSQVSFEVASGESVVLRGANGSGKTTVFLLAMGLLCPRKGTIVVCDIPVGARASKRRIPDATLVLQWPQAQLFMPTVWEEVRVRASDDEAVGEELEFLALEPLKDRHPRSLSMGQMRRLTLAAALAARPRLLLLDEPSVGQDDRSLKLMIRRLSRFVGEGGALLSATHDERVAAVLGQRELFLEKGTIHERKGGRYEGVHGDSLCLPAVVECARGSIHGKGP